MLLYTILMGCQYEQPTMLNLACRLLVSESLHIGNAACQIAAAIGEHL